MRSAFSSAECPSIIQYEHLNSCPLCGSHNYTKGSQHREILQPAALPANLMHSQGNVSFVSALCEDCGASFNLDGLSDETRITLSKNSYAFLKPSQGVGVSNYNDYLDIIMQYLPHKNQRFAEIGGYDGYTPATLSKHGYTDLSLIEPSPQIEKSLVEQGKVKLYKGFFPEADPVWSYHELEYSERKEHLYDVIAARDVFQMLGNPLQMLKSINICLKTNGLAICSSGDIDVMHPQQKLHLGLNAYRTMARAAGFTIVKTIKPHRYSTVFYVMRKEVDLVSDGQAAKDFCAAAPCSKEDFEKEQLKQREIVKRTRQTDAEALKRLNDAVTKHHNLGHEIILYGTGYTCSELMGNLQIPLSKLNLTIVNSDKYEDGYLYLRPDDQTNIVHYAGSYLKDKHIPLIVLAVRSKHFKQEIEQLLKSINCQCDELLFIYDND